MYPLLLRPSYFQWLSRRNRCSSHLSMRPQHSRLRRQILKVRLLKLPRTVSNCVADGCLMAHTVENNAWLACVTVDLTSLIVSIRCHLRLRLDHHHRLPPKWVNLGTLHLGSLQYCHLLVDSVWGRLGPPLLVPCHAFAKKVVAPVCAPPQSAWFNVGCNCAVSQPPPMPSLFLPEPPAIHREFPKYPSRVFGLDVDTMVPASRWQGQTFKNSA